MILQPEKTISPLKCRIDMKGMISVTYPERNYTLIDIVKAHGFIWEWPHWKRKIDELFNGTVLDRTIEIAHALLCAGFILDIDIEPDMVLRITDGEFEPEHKRWIKRLNDSFLIQWPRGEDFYNAARRLHGSKYESPFVTVPGDAYQEVLDFADQHNFRLSEKAQALSDEMAIKRAEAVLVVPVRKKKEVVKPVVAVGEIDLELLDVDTNDANV